MNKNLFFVAAITATTLLTLGAGCSSSKTSTPSTNQTTSVVNTTTNTAATNNVNTVNANTDVVVFDETASDKAIKADVNGQWAKSATASTSYGTDSWSAKQATGEPNVDEYGDNVNAWAPAEQNKGLETLELTYAKAVSAIGVRIRENDGSGSVTKVELKDTDGKYYTVWEGTDTTKGLNYFQVPVDKTTYKVSGVRVTIDTTKVPTEWVEIDAVQLVGE